MAPSEPPHVPARQPFREVMADGWGEGRGERGAGPDRVGAGPDRAVVLDAIIPEAASRKLLAQDHRQPVDETLAHAHDVPCREWAR